MADIEMKFDVDSMTLGQTEFVTDYTKRTVQELFDVLKSGDLSTRDLIAIMALSRNPDDPASELEAVRNLKVVELDVANLT